MENKMRELSQKLIDFEIMESFDKKDYFVSKSNYYAKKIIDSWPKWDKKIVNISGEEYSGKTHLSKIFKSNTNALYLKAQQLDDQILKQIKLSDCIIIEDLNEDVSQKLLYSIFNLVEQDNKFLLLSSKKPVNSMEFSLPDLVSRLKNCLTAKLELPDDDLIYAIILKKFSDRQITIDRKIIEYVVKRISRSYRNIHEFIYKIDELSLKKKKSINIKIIKEIIN